jgi:hypothetical protein
MQGGMRRALGWGSRLGVAILGVACGSDDERTAINASSPAEDRSDELYDPARRLEVQVEMAAADWSELREQGYSLFEFQRGEAGDFDYTFFDAAVTIDGERVESVSVRKKGGLGSLSRLRPSLILDLNRNVPGQSLLSVSRLTLNNDRTSPSHNRQCMAYELYTRAGLPAPRCNLAHVVVNGEDLGTFSNVEPIRKPFLARHFESDEGNLYEGREDGDFTPDGVERFQIETNESDNDRSDLRAVVGALQADDSRVIEELSKVVDLDQFRTFWALETLTGNWDTYSGNTNNFYLYHDPESDRFVFLPWGTDTAFTGGSVVDSFNQTLTVYATGALANRLYNLPDERARFRGLLSELHDTLWDVPALTARLTQLAELSTDAWPGAVEQQREYIATYSERLRDELAQPAPEWRLGGIDLAGGCAGDIATMSGEFQTTWLSGPVMASPESGQFQASLNIAGQSLTAPGFSRAGRDPAGADPSVSLQLIGALADGRLLFFQIQLAPGAFAVGTQPFYNFENVGFAGVIAADQTFQFLGLLGDGTVELESATMMDGAPVAGTFTAQLYQTNCFE